MTASATRSNRRSRDGRSISRLNTQPARTPVNASPPPLRATAHDSGDRAVRYAFSVWNSHPQHLAGLCRRTIGTPKCTDDSEGRGRRWNGLSDHEVSTKQPTTSRRADPTALLHAERRRCADSGVNWRAPVVPGVFQEAMLAAMRTLSSDTSPEAERVQILLLRKATEARRFEMTCSLSQAVIDLSRRALRERMPGADERDVLIRWIALHYGEALAEGVARRLGRAG